MRGTDAAAEPTFSISDLAREFGITTRTIRHYEDVGLLQPRREGQKRIYGRGDRTRLKLVLRGRRLGFSLQESKDIIELYQPGHSQSGQLHALLDRIEAQRERLIAQMRDVETMLGELDEVETLCRKELHS